MTPLGPGMAAELREFSEAVERQAEALGSVVADLAKRLKRRPPQVVVTCARGSSAHAATFVKHLIERHLGIPVAAAAPNIATIYRSPARAPRPALPRHLAVGPERRSDRNGPHGASGRRTHGRARQRRVEPAGGGLRDRSADRGGTGAQRSSDKNFRCLSRRVAAPDGNVDGRCGHTPRLRPAAGTPRRSNAARLERGSGRVGEVESLVTIGRGPTLAIAREAALKLKEICTLHAEAFSSAEFRHGPIALVSRTYPILVLAPTDEAAPGISDLIADLRRDGACVLVAAAGERTTGVLPALAPEQPDADAICLIQSFYAFLVRLAQRRGADVEHPRHLQKVTRTR